MKLKFLRFASASLLAAGSMTAQAEAPSLRIPSHMVSARPASLGGAFTAVADDQNALFYNPAGLAFLDSTFFSLADIEFFASLGSGGIGDLIDDATKISSAASKVASEKDTAKQIDNISSLGELVSSKSAVAGSKLQMYLARKRWGLALTGGVASGLGIHSKLLPEVLDLALLADVDARFGYSHPLFDGKVSLGAAPYYKLRAQGGRANLSLNEALEPENSMKSLVSVGQGIGLDLGLMVRPVAAMSPTFGLAILNVGDTRLRFAGNTIFKSVEFLSDAEKVGAPDSIKQIVNAGFSISPIDGRGFVRLSGELREINRPTAAELKPAFGVEGGFRSNFIRTLASAGWGNGGWSAGLELRAFVKLRLSSYIEPNLFFDRVKSQRVWVLSAGL